MIKVLNSVAQGYVSAWARICKNTVYTIRVIYRLWPELPFKIFLQNVLTAVFIPQLLHKITVTIYIVNS